MSENDLENYDTNEYHKEKESNIYDKLLSEAEESNNPMDIYKKIINSKDSKNKNFEIYRLLTLALISIQKLDIEEFEQTAENFLIEYSKNKEPYTNEDSNKIIKLSNKINAIKSENEDKIEFFISLEDLLKKYGFMIDYFYIGIEICYYLDKDEDDKEKLIKKLSSIKEELDKSDITEEKDNIKSSLEDIEDKLYDDGLDYEQEGTNNMNKRDFNEAIAQYMKAYTIYLALKKEDDALNIIRYSFGASLLEDENAEFRVDSSPGLNYLINYFKNENIKPLFETYQDDFSFIMNKLRDNYQDNDNMEKNKQSKAKKDDKEIRNKDKSSNSQINSKLGKLLGNIKIEKGTKNEDIKERNNKNDNYNYDESSEYYNENVNEFIEKHKNLLEIDLHGFRLKESLSIVEKKIDELKDKIFHENLKKLDLTIITGRGNKSWKHQPILHPNITILLKKKREFTVKTDQGVIYVTIYKKRLE